MYFNCKTGSVSSDGNDCGSVCPMTCPFDHMICPGGISNGCLMPDTCVSTTGRTRRL